MISCSTIRKMLKKIVKFPSVNGKLRLNTYGIDEIGDVPRFALVIRLTPREFTNSPIRNIKYRFSFSINLYLLLVVQIFAG